MKVGCSNCGQPLGIALVGVNAPAPASTCVHGRPKLRSESKPTDWSKRDVERFSNKPKISYDDVLEAHEFFESLGSDWAKYLPKPGTKRQP